MPTEDTLSRRRFLASSAAAGVVATAGCIDSFSQETRNNTEETDKNFVHPSTRGLTQQPYIGPVPSEDQPVIIAFEDLSCPICRSFHDNAFQTLQTYAESQELTFVFRATDFAGYPWGETAALVQEAVYDQQPDKTFDIIKSYYDTQERFTESNVLSESRSLVDNAGLEANSVIETVENGGVTEDFNLDTSAGIDSEVRGTPSFMLFQDGSYETKVVGAKSASVFESILNL